MSAFSRLIRFESTDGQVYFADLEENEALPSETGPEIDAYTSFEELVSKKNQTSALVKKLLAPVPSTTNSIYCVGLNYRTHAAEANLNLPKYPPLWTKPAATLANPGEDIALNKFCASSFPDYEGELVFVTSRECRDISPKEAESYILGYTTGNDLSCRMFQMPDVAGGQFFYAKAFDKFAPLGPVLVSPEVFAFGNESKLVTKVNGKVRQEVGILKDMIFSPAQVLSHMSQGTTIPAFTSVMTGTPAGVGVFTKPRAFLNDGDVVTVEISNIGTLQNKIVFLDSHLLDAELLRIKLIKQGFASGIYPADLGARYA